MPLLKVARLSALADGSVTEHIEGEDRYAVCRVGDEIHVIDGICPHSGGPLGQGALHGTKLVCPWHAWEFDCTTGESDLDPELKQRKFPARVQGDDILIES